MSISCSFVFNAYIHATTTGITTEEAEAVREVYRYEGFWLVRKMCHNVYFIHVILARVLTVVCIYDRKRKVGACAQMIYEIDEIDDKVLVVAVERCREQSRHNLWAMTLHRAQHACMHACSSVLYKHTYIIPDRQQQQQFHPVPTAAGSGNNYRLFQLM